MIVNQKLKNNYKGKKKTNWHWIDFSCKIISILGTIQNIYIKMLYKWTACNTQYALFMRVISVTKCIYYSYMCCKEGLRCVFWKKKFCTLSSCLFNYNCIEHAISPRISNCNEFLQVKHISQVPNKPNCHQIEMYYLWPTC